MDLQNSSSSSLRYFHLLHIAPYHVFKTGLILKAIFTHQFKISVKCYVIQNNLPSWKIPMKSSTNPANKVNTNANSIGFPIVNCTVTSATRLVGPISTFSTVPNIKYISGPEK